MTDIEIVRTYKYKGVTIERLKGGIKSEAYSGLAGWLVRTISTLPNGNWKAHRHFFYTRRAAQAFIDSYESDFSADSIGC